MEPATNSAATIAHLEAIAENPLVCELIALQVEGRMKIRDALPHDRLDGADGKHLFLGAILQLRNGAAAHQKETPRAATKVEDEPADASIKAIAEKLAPYAKKTATDAVPEATDTANDGQTTEGAS